MNGVSATVFSGVEYAASDVIESDFFGGNHLFLYDYSDGTFPEKVEYLNITLLRYPGGAMTEWEFDVNDPDAVPEGEQRETLSEFLSYVGQNAITPVLVLPIKKYIAEGVPIEQAALEISNFVKRVTSGEFGDVKIDMFEIGNEFSWGDDSVSASDYGAYASAFALAIKEASEYEVDVAVQTGTHWSNASIAIEDNNQIMAEFELAGAFEAVDILVAHFYPANIGNVADRLAVALPDQVVNDWEAATGKSLEIFISEWNTETSYTPAFSEFYGLAHAAAMIEMVSEMAKAGVDMSAVWAIQQNTLTELTAWEGVDKVRIGGEIFRMLSQSTVGTSAVDIPQDVIGGGQVLLHAFENETKLVVFLSAQDIINNSSPYTVDLNIESFGSNFKYVWGEKLSTYASNILSANAVPKVTNFFPSLGIDGSNSSVSVTFEGDYEVIKLVFIKDVIGDSPLQMVGDDIDDIFYSGHGDDLIDGFAGNDRLFGKGGDDKVSGGDGADFIKGNSGNDLIYAGNGDDFVWGGVGNDYIKGGDGNDYLGGGLGEDELFGERGDDTIKGGEGDDILNGGEGNDVLGGGRGDDTLFGSEGEDLLKGGPGNDILYGGTENDVLRGSFGNDLIVGGFGDDVLWGGAGQDTFVFSGSSGHDIIKDFETNFDSIEIENIAFNQVIQTISGRGLELSFEGASILIEQYFTFLPESDFLVI